MKLFQLVMAFLGGSAAIYGGLENGYGVGFLAFMSAYLSTILLARAGDLWRYAKKRNNPSLSQRRPTTWR